MMVLTNTSLHRKTDTRDGNPGMIKAHNQITLPSYPTWEFWDDNYVVPPAMLSKVSCGKVCSKSGDLYNLLPNKYPDNRKLLGTNKTCAVISSSQIIDSHEYGANIDSHDIVLRFNLHQIGDPKCHGSKTTHMMVHCGFWNPSEPQYKKLYLIQNRTENIILFYARMHHEFKKGPLTDIYLKKTLFPHYITFLKERKLRLKQTFILNHHFVKRSRNAFEVSSGVKLKYYPSSGWMGIFLLSRTCVSITAFGFSDNELKKDYKNLGKGITHNFQGEHNVMKRWTNYQNPSVTLKMLP